VRVSFLWVAVTVACGSPGVRADGELRRQELPGGTKRAFTAAVIDGKSLLAMWAPERGHGLRSSQWHPERPEWTIPRAVLPDVGSVSGLALLSTGNAESLVLLTVETGSAQSLYARQSEDGGDTWSAGELLRSASVGLHLVTHAKLSDGAFLVTFVEAQSSTVLFKRDAGGSWRELFPRVGNENVRFGANHRLLAGADGGVAAYLGFGHHCYYRSQSPDGIFWRMSERINLPFAVGAQAAALARLTDNRVVAVGNDNVLRPGEVAVRVSYDGGRRWPVRRVMARAAEGVAATLLSTKAGRLHVMLQGDGGRVRHLEFDEEWLNGMSHLSQRPPLANVASPAMPGRPVKGKKVSLPIVDAPYVAHVGTRVKDGKWRQAERPTAAGLTAEATTDLATQGGRDWIGSAEGLFVRVAGTEDRFERYPHYGVAGPAASAVTGLAVDSRDVLWAATRGGLSRRDSKGEWLQIRGRDGLPWDELTAIAIDSNDRLWLGSTRGLIHYRPYGEGRQWFYRTGPRYVPSDQILELKLSDDGSSVMAQSSAGIGRVDEVERTLGGKARFLQDRLEERHRRPVGIPSPCGYDDPLLMTKWSHTTQPSDGLWTGYHVAAMSLAYSLTSHMSYKRAARKGMEALYLLQNVTGVTGLVARSVMSADEPGAVGRQAQSNWHKTSDGRYYWRDDVSSDQIDGHYLAFYTYFEHIAQFDPDERYRIEKQVRQVTDYILDNDYQIIDWDGERTLWGWWDPKRVNEEPEHYLESGLYSLMMLSFLKTAYYITDEPRYREHFLKLAQEHGYVSNLLLEKRLFPDELNHSDDQLSAVAYYPILQLEHDPFVREALGRAVRRHAVIEAPERNAFFALVHASIDPAGADVAGAIRTLREMPQDRRSWRMRNSHRLDVAFQPRSSRSGRPVLAEVLPYDEHHFERWNQDPYMPDSGGDGSSEGAGIHYLLPYWLARYHGVLTAPMDSN
jgi:hypothetical protein